MDILINQYGFAIGRFVNKNIVLQTVTCILISHTHIQHAAHTKPLDGHSYSSKQNGF
jgi:hypothetical protein